MKIYIAKAGNQQGPYSLEELNKLAQSEPITGDDQCWYEGCAEWIPLSQLPGFIPAPPPSTKAAPEVFPQRQPPIAAGTGLSSTAAHTGENAADKLKRYWKAVLQFFLNRERRLPTFIALSCLYPIGLALLCRSRVFTQRWKIIAGVAFGVIFLAIVSSSQHHLFRSTPTISSIEDVQKYIVGTWTDTSGKEFWNKLIFKRDGSVEEYLARPADDNWGKAMMKTWKPITAKYSDTGLRYYGIEVTGFGKHLVLTDDGHLRFRIGPDMRMEFTKGDKFPFSK